MLVLERWWEVGLFFYANRPPQAPALAVDADWNRAFRDVTRHHGNAGALMQLPHSNMETQLHV